MMRLILVGSLLATAACVPATTYVGGPAPIDSLPVHPDPLCFYTEPFAPGEPLGVVCA